MKILVTGSAGSIGFHTTQALLKQGHHLIGIDNLNDYYVIDLKYQRLRYLTEFCKNHNCAKVYQFVEINIANKRAIDIFNHGKMQRDFTYIDDIVEGIVRMMDHIPLPQKSNITTSDAPYKIYNISNNQPKI